MNFRVLPMAPGVLAVVALLGTERLPAQDDDPLVEITSLKKVVEEQGKQIEALAAQVAKLVARLDGTATETEPTAGSPGNQAAPLVATPLATEPGTIPYIVERGDSLEKIAKARGTTTSELQELNHITDPNKLQIGQRILLPAGLPPKAEP